MKAMYLIVVAAILLVSCSQEPEPIHYGKDVCEHCKMTIMDIKYGAEIVTRKGKVFKFDAAECLVDYIKDHQEKFDLSKDRILTTNIAAPESLIDAKAAFFLVDRAFQSPMGGNLASFTSKQLAENNLQSADGRILTWTELIKGM